MNPTNLEIYVDPAFGRDDDFDPSFLDLTWQMKNYTELIFYIQINFSNPA